MTPRFYFSDITELLEKGTDHDLSLTKDATVAGIENVAPSMFGVIVARSDVQMGDISRRKGARNCMLDADRYQAVDSSSLVSLSTSRGA